MGAQAGNADQITDLESAGYSEFTAINSDLQRIAQKAASTCR
jgi:hypothetical protein